MPWKVATVSECRRALVGCVRAGGMSVAQAAVRFGVSRACVYKWLAVADRDPSGCLCDRSRRPLSSPSRTGEEVEQRVLELRDTYNWGPRKVHAVLKREGLVGLPSMRTVANILTRHGRVERVVEKPTVTQRFERPAPNDLWQVDHKGAIEVNRVDVLPFTVLDDYSRYCLAFDPLLDKTMFSCWNTVLWPLFGEVGLPLALLSDNAFNTPGTARPAGLSWFDGCLVRLGIDSIHGRPYHPQTQGKVEALHKSSVRELIRFNARRDDVRAFTQDCHRWRNVYNTLRPHEALDDQPPATRWTPSPRKRPATLPDPTYPTGATLRVTCREGLVRWRGCRILVGRGITGLPVMIEETTQELSIRFCHKLVRVLSSEQMTKDRVL
jgi:transposase InsO family protein